MLMCTNWCKFQNRSTAKPKTTAREACVGEKVPAKTFLNIQNALQFGISLQEEETQRVTLATEYFLAMN